jgi:penicillin V acylase-like amidase (Ntn superfamily)
MANDKIMRILQSEVGSHFFVSDATGNCASIEWLDGTIVCHSGQSMPHKVLANSTYDQSLAFLRLFSAFDGFLPLPHPIFYRGSLLRFAIVADMLQTFDPQTSGPAIDYAFNILQDVEIQPLRNSAVWSAVYDPSHKKICFRSYNNDRIRQFDLSAFDFSCSTPVKALDVQAELEGDVTESFIDYTEEMSRAMLDNFSLPQGAIDYFATYPEKYTSCTADNENDTQGGE